MHIYTRYVKLYQIVLMPAGVRVLRHTGPISKRLLTFLAPPSKKLRWVRTQRAPPPRSNPATFRTPNFFENSKITLAFVNKIAFLSNCIVFNDILHTKQHFTDVGQSDRPSKKCSKPLYNTTSLYLL